MTTDLNSKSEPIGGTCFSRRKRVDTGLEGTVNILVVLVGDAHPTVHALNINVFLCADVHGRTNVAGAWSAGATFTLFAAKMIFLCED